MNKFTTLHGALVTTLAALCAATTLPAMAQSSTTTSSGDGWMPFVHHRYVGINLGKTKLDSPCGTGGYACDDPSVTANIYTGGLFNDWAGAEIGYFRTSNADRSGGTTRIQGLNLGLVLRAPIGPFNAYLKGGAVYGEARVSAGPLSDVTAGTKRGWGPSYSVGVGYDFVPNSGVVLDWTRNEVKFPAGGDREKVDTASIGYVFRF